MSTLLLAGLTYRQLGSDTSASAPFLCQEGRTTRDIIWTCLSVIFLCTWTSVHPNVPSIPRSDHWALVLWDQTKIFFVALIAPELIVLWSIRQWFAARKMAKVYQIKKYDWTTTHAFFALMGGFAFYNSEGKFLFHLWDDRFCQHFKTERHWDGVSAQEEKLRELSGDNGSKQYSSLLEYCVANKLINLTEDEIRGLGHSDFLGKIITLVQTLQFIVTCIARGAEGLAITELEFLTLGFAALNLVSYSFWWHKPLGTQFPVHVMDRPTSIPRLDTQNSETESKLNSIDIATTTPSKTRKPGLLGAFAHRIREDYDSSHPLFVILVVPLLAVSRLFGYALSADAAAKRPQPERGNIFSATTIKESPLTYAFSYSTAAILGVFHCIPIMLNYRHFPGHSKDHHLWTGFALSTTVMPLAVGITHVATHLKAQESKGSVPFNLLLILIFVLSYSTARIALVVLAAKQLADLPASALQDVEWTDFVPHFDI
ncbi:hypothetical protein PM082_017554 [Marasmius tenuissimus]|nr:hypothetical protein PM082_017554 [Marasmius tenuissimus]